MERGKHIFHKTCSCRKAPAPRQTCRRQQRGGRRQELGVPVRSEAKEDSCALGTGLGLRVRGGPSRESQRAASARGGWGRSPLPWALGSHPLLCAGAVGGTGLP